MTLKTADGTLVDAPKLTPKRGRTKHSPDDPLTKNQLGRIMGEFQRLGWSITYPQWEIERYSQWVQDRQSSETSERLRILSALAGREITSVKDLTSGEAGKIVRTLVDCPDTDALYVSLPSEPEKESSYGPLLIAAGAILIALGMKG